MSLPGSPMLSDAQAPAGPRRTRPAAASRALIVTVWPATGLQARLGTDIGARRDGHGARRAVTAAGLLARAIYVERGTMQGEQIMPLSDGPEDGSPYFSMVLIPGQGRRL